jgi:hypothetical protein
MALNQEEKERLGFSIVDQLAQTPYACTSLEVLSGGTANFLFRGSLIQSLPDGRNTIVVKHFKEFVSANRNFKLDISRCVSFPFLFCVLILRMKNLEYTYADS